MSQYSYDGFVPGPPPNGLVFRYSARTNALSQWATLLFARNHPILTYGGASVTLLVTRFSINAGTGVIVRTSSQVAGTLTAANPSAPTAAELNTFFAAKLTTAATTLSIASNDYVVTNVLTESIGVEFSSTGDSIVSF